MFAAFTIMRLKPLVLIATDDDRNERIASIRRSECRQAVKLLGAEVRFLAIPESKLTVGLLQEKLHRYRNCLTFAPAKQGGHPHHDIVADSVEEAIRYATYTKSNLSPVGNVEVRPTEDEARRKMEALSYYKSQIPQNQAHFDAVRGKSEFYVQ